MAANGEETHGNHPPRNAPESATPNSDERERLIGAMYDYIVHGDYRAVTLADVGRRANVDPGTLHRCFPTMDDLVMAVYDWQSAGGAWLYAELAEVLADPRSSDMPRWIGAAVDYWEDNRAFLYPMHQIGSLAPEITRYTVNALQVSIGRVVMSLPGLPEQRRSDLKMTLQMLFMQLDAVCFDAFARGVRIDRENVVRLLSDIWESTLRP